MEALPAPGRAARFHHHRSPSRRTRSTQSELALPFIAPPAATRSRSLAQDIPWHACGRRAGTAGGRGNRGACGGFLHHQCLRLDPRRGSGRRARPCDRFDPTRLTISTAHPNEASCSRASFKALSLDNDLGPDAMIPTNFPEDREGPGDREAHAAPRPQRRRCDPGDARSSAPSSRERPFISPTP